MQVKLMTDSLRSAEFSSYSKVPDPYYGGTKGFDLVSAPARPASEGRRVLPAGGFCHTEVWGIDVACGHPRRAAPSASAAASSPLSGIRCLRAGAGFA